MPGDSQTPEDQIRRRRSEPTDRQHRLHVLVPEGVGVARAPATRLEDAPTRLASRTIGSAALARVRSDPTIPLAILERRFREGRIRDAAARAAPGRAAVVSTAHEEPKHGRNR